MIRIVIKMQLLFYAHIMGSFPHKGQQVRPTYRPIDPLPLKFGGAFVLYQPLIKSSSVKLYKHFEHLCDKHFF